MSNILAVIGDNFNTNKSIAKRIGPTFVWLDSHRFNLAVQYILKIQTDDIDVVQGLMKTLSYTFL